MSDPVGDTPSLGRMLEEEDRIIRHHIRDHVEAHVGAVSGVWEEQDPLRIPLQIMRVAPRPDRPWWTLVSAGMSRLPMPTLQDHPELAHAELTVSLPAEWPMGADDVISPDAWWPLGVMRWMANLPWERQTWFGWWHSVSNGDPPLPFDPAAPFAGVLITPPLLTTPAFHVARTPAHPVHMLAMIFLHPEEVRMRAQASLEDLVALLGEHEVSELANPTRPSTCFAQGNTSNF